MPVHFDAYVMVDWSAASTPKRGADSIWWTLASWTPRGLHVETPENPPTRFEAMRALHERLARALDRGLRVLVGFDFAFGYPAGTAKALGLPGEPWRAIWEEWSHLAQDAPTNANNRFEVASALNARISGGVGPFWGHPHGRTYPHLTARKSFSYPVKGLVEKTLTHERTPRAQPVWKLCGVGSVGSQTLLGIPHLHRMLEEPHFKGRIHIWPFQTGFTLPPRPSKGQLLLVEIYPSLVTVHPKEGEVKDRLQVEALARHFAERDTRGTLIELFEPPSDLSFAQREAAMREEGWILGTPNSKPSRVPPG